MTPDQERWAEALAIERARGQNAPRWVAERIGALALAGDHAGVERFIEIARRLELLLGGTISDQRERRTDPVEPRGST